MNVPVIEGAQASEIDALPANTLFVLITDQHWLCGLKGEHGSLIFDSLGLPQTTLEHLMGNVPFHPWNRYGYQAMFSTVCGYYVLVVIQEVIKGSLRHNADVDKVLSYICPNRLPRPSGMPQWYHQHRAFNKELEENDEAVKAYVAKIYPHIPIMDHNAALGPVASNTLLGSPLYAHAGIHMPTVRSKYAQLKMLTQSADPQSGRAYSTQLLPADDNAYVSGKKKAQTGRQSQGGYNPILAAMAASAPRAQPYAAPPTHRKMTTNERILWARQSLGMYNPPSGASASGNSKAVNEEATPSNITSAIAPHVR